MSIIRVEPEALTADGIGLADAQMPVAPPVAAAPAADPVSQGVSALLDAHSSALVMAVEHSGMLRAHGGAVLSQAGAALRGTDDDNAALIAAVISGAASGAALSAAGLSIPPAPPGVMLPEMPAMTPPPMLPGEQFSALIHNGEGSGTLLDFADTWRGHGGRLDDLADQVLARSAAIDEHWFDGAQQAGANTREHGSWLRGSADQAHKIAGVATDVADEFDSAKGATPTPEQFAQVRQDLLTAQARRDPIGAAHAAQRYVTLQGQATDAAMDYHTGVSAATARLGEPLKTAPAIAGGGPTIQPVDNGTGPTGPVDPRNPFVGDERFGQWVNVVPPPYVGKTPPPPWTGHRPIDGVPGHPAGPSGFYVPGGQPWADDNAPPLADLKEQYRFRISGEDYTPYTRMVNGQQQQWVQYSYDAQRYTQLEIGGPAWASTSPNEITGELGGTTSGGLAGLNPPPAIDAWKPITLPQIGSLSGQNPGVTYYIPNGCGGQFTWSGGVPAGIQPPPSPPVMIAEP